MILVPTYFDIGVPGPCIFRYKGPAEFGGIYIGTHNSKYCYNGTLISKYAKNSENGCWPHLPYGQPIQQQIIPYDGIKKRADQPIVWDDR